MHKEGASIVENAHVHDIKHIGPGCLQRVYLHNTFLDCKHVLLASNGYTGWKFKNVRKKIIPVGSYIVCSKILSESMQNNLSPNSRIFFDSRKLINYFRLTPDGRLLFGGRDGLAHQENWQKITRQLQRRMQTIFPQLEGESLEYSWGGKLGVSLDMMPHLQKKKELLQPMVIVGMGFRWLAI